MERAAAILNVYLRKSSLESPLYGFFLETLSAIQGITPRYHQVIHEETKISALPGLHYFWPGVRLPYPFFFHQAIEHLKVCNADLFICIPDEPELPASPGADSGGLGMRNQVSFIEGRLLLAPEQFLSRREPLHTELQDYTKENLDHLLVKKWVSEAKAKTISRMKLVEQNEGRASLR